MIRLALPLALIPSLVLAQIQPICPGFGPVIGGSGGGGSGTSLIPVSAAPGDSCAGVTSGNIALTKELLGPPTEGIGASTTIMYCDGSIWQALGSYHVQLLGAPPDPSAYCSVNDIVLVVGGMSGPIDMYVCQTLTVDGGSVNQYVQTFNLVNGNTSVVNGIPVADGSGWNMATISPDMYVDGGTVVVEHSITADVCSALSATLPVSEGGTGVTTLTNHSYMIGHGTATIGTVGPCTDGQLSVGDTDDDPACQTVTNDFTLTKQGTATLASPITHFQIFSDLAFNGNIRYNPTFRDGTAATLSNFGPWNFKGASTATLPACSGSTGFTTTAKAIVNSTATIITTGGETIEGNSSYVISNGQAVTLTCGNCLANGDSVWCISL